MHYHIQYSIQWNLLKSYKQVNIIKKHCFYRSNRIYVSLQIDMHFYKISRYIWKSIENSLSNSRSCFLCCFCCCSCCLCQLSWQLNVACLINTNCRGESKQREARSSADQKLAKPDQNQDCEANCGQAAMLCAPLLRQQQHRQQKQLLHLQLQLVAAGGATVLCAGLH